LKFLLENYLGKAFGTEKMLTLIYFLIEKENNHLYYFTQKSWDELKDKCDVELPEDANKELNQENEELEYELKALTSKVIFY
jgi:hypothetical protein